MRAVLTLLLLVTAAADAAEMRSVVVDRDEDRYWLESEVWFDAAAEALYAVFLDYDLSAQFSSAITESRNLEPAADGRRRFYIRNEGCVAFFCTSFERYGFVEHEPHRLIRASIDPAQSDFLRSDESWSFRAEGDGTVVRYRVEFVPKFWVPPVIGPYLIRRKLSEHGGGAIQRIEALANGHQP